MHLMRRNKGRSFLIEWESVCDDGCVVVGDFNVWCGKLDVSAAGVFRSDASRGVLRKLLKEKNMIDVWREGHPEGREFTRRQVVKNTLKQS